MFRAERIFLGDEETPLVVRRPIGLGNVTALAIDPDTPAFKRWDGVETFWIDMLDPAGIGSSEKRFEVMGPHRADMDVYRGVQGLVDPGLRPSVRLGIVVLLTALYALAVGPGDYFLVRKLGRPKLTWVTFPIIVAVFTAAAYYGARFYVGGELSQMYQDRIRIYADQKVTTRYEVASIFAPVGRRYDINLEEDGAILPVRLEARPGDPIIDVVLDEGVVSQHVPIWTRRFFERRTKFEQAAGVDFELTIEDGRVIATIQNNLEMPLTDITVAYKKSILNAQGETIMPGASSRIDLGQSRKLDVDQSRASWPREVSLIETTL